MTECISTAISPPSLRQIRRSLQCPASIDAIRDRHWPAVEPGRRDDLPGLAAGTAVEVGDQIAYGAITAGREQLVELRDVIPVRRRLAGVALSCPRQPDSPLRPIERAGVARERRAEADLDTGAGRPLGGTHRDDRCAAIALRPQYDPLVAGDDAEGAAGGQNGASDDPQPLPRAPRWGRRRSLVDTIGRRMENRAAISTGVPSMPGPLSSTK